MADQQQEPVKPAGGLSRLWKLLRRPSGTITVLTLLVLPILYRLAHRPDEQAVDVTARLQHRFYEAVERRAVAGQGKAKPQAFALAEDRQPMHANGSAEQDNIAGPGIRARDL